QWRWDAEQNRIALPHARKISRGLKASGGVKFGDGVGRNVLDVTCAGGELVGLRGVDVEADDVKALPAEFEHQRQTDVAKADDSNDGFAPLNASDGFIAKGLGGHGDSGRFLLAQRCGY